MRVEDPNLAASSIATAPAAAPSTATTRGNAAERSGDTDRVELSGFAGRLGGALRAESQTRAQRVAGLEREFQSGSFSRDARQTSRALVQETLTASAGERAGQGKT
jgi:anti-sigma28 factor (negative regulator of flagellin synthesis)